VAEAPFDSLTPSTRSQLALGKADTDTIKHEIERTRVEMGETIGEIHDRLRPDHLLQQARDGVRRAAAGKARSIMNSAGETAATVAYQARGVGDSLAGYVREHPIQVAVTVGALTWWMLRGRNQSEDWYGMSDTTWYDDAGEMPYEGEGRSLRNRVGEYASSARDTVGEYATTARETVGEYASSARETVGEYASSARETVGEYASSARETVGEYAGSARDRARRAAGTATTTVDDWVHENPLAVGAIALAVGAAIGMSVPATEIENRTMGEARDRAWQRASKAAADIKDNVTRKVETVAENFVSENIVDPITGSAREPMGSA
jgi:ElaB/YqjD/DUF883 family membrane-anchored ribosome-binding protein